MYLASVCIDLHYYWQHSIIGKCDCCSMREIQTQVIAHSKANILGVEFTAGQDIVPGKRCGSILTSVIDGQSMYGKVLKFFSCACNKNTGVYAFVEWMNVPDYPMSGTPLVVRLRDNALACTAPPVLSIFDIDPSRVIVERSDTEACYYMCRIEGLDTIKTS